MNSSPARSLDWSLDPQLASDTVPLGDLALSRVLLMQDANYPWLILVPRLADIVEITDLDRDARTALMQEIGEAAAALKTVTACDKINVAALGNMVPQLHVHVIARSKVDPAWPKPVWGQVPPRAYDPVARTHLMDALRPQLWSE
jgi:diadenosine tetraphosphate (Ap4A) HIT family hydrolase